MILGEQIQRHEGQQSSSTRVHEQRPQKAERRWVDQQQRDEPKRNFILRLSLLLVLDEPRAETAHSVNGGVDSEREHEEGKTDECGGGIAYKD